MNVATNMNVIYRRLIADIITDPDRIGTTRKGEKIYERFNYSFTLTEVMDSFVDVRPASWKYLLNEFNFYASGDNRLSEAEKLSKFWRNCTDDGETINSNYGKLLFYDRNERGISQFQHALACLRNNPDSKKAVMSVYNPDHAYMSNDNPCTMFLHLYTSRIFRDNRAVTLLHMSAYMRSNDIWFGVPYDVPYFCSVLYAAWRVLFTEFQERHNQKLELGTYTHYACSLHAYDRNKGALLEAARRPLGTCVDSSALREAYAITVGAAARSAGSAPVPLTVQEAAVEAWREAERSACLKKRCGAVLLNEHGIVVGRGTNGREYTTCTSCARDAGEVFYSDGCYSIHAEMRAIFEAQRRYPRLDWRKTTMITTHGPCDACMKLMEFLGIPVCYYDKPYKTNYARYPRVHVRPLNPCNV